MPCPDPVEKKNVSLSCLMNIVGITAQDYKELEVQSPESRVQGPGSRVLGPESIYDSRFP